MAMATRATEGPVCRPRTTRMERTAPTPRDMQPNDRIKPFETAACTGVNVGGRCGAQPIQSDNPPSSRKTLPAKPSSVSRVRRSQAALPGSLQPPGHADGPGGNQRHQVHLPLAGGRRQQQHAEPQRREQQPARLAARHAAAEDSRPPQSPAARAPRAGAAKESGSSSNRSAAYGRSGRSAWCGRSGSPGWRPGTP